MVAEKQPHTGRRDARRNAGLGTFGGVFAPSVLTILGIILFRRLGFVVGSTGLARALLMLLLASLISILTTVSLSAIATNRKVRGGGDYYLISRTLGVEFGGCPRSYSLRSPVDLTGFLLHWLRRGHRLPD